MELFTIDPNNNHRRDSLIEHYESFVWTDRYSAYGDFQIVAEPSKANIQRLVPDVMVGFDQTRNAMIIDTAEVAEDEDGKTKLTISGKSYVNALNDRVAKKSWTGDWTLTGSPGIIVRDMVAVICTQGAGFYPQDVFPGMACGDQSGATGSYSVVVKDGTLYERVKEVADSFDLGFRIRIIPGDPTVRFEVYKGVDRTGWGGVAFSEDLENLSSTRHLKSKAGHKNLAYVYAPNGQRLVGASGATNELTGRARRVLYVDASDITLAAGTALQNALQQRGRDALSEHQITDLFDGTVNPNGPYGYGKQYNLGDIVDLVGDGGIKGPRQKMRVTEHIWAYDVEGFKSYPTLSAYGGV